MKVLYDTVLRGTFLRRPNRFVVYISLNGNEVAAHLPNPGRMWELLYTGVGMYVVPHEKPGAKTAYRVIGIERDGAMFPDAITERGRKHLLHLAALRKDGYRAGVLFLVQWDRAQWFLPDYHTDLAFAETFRSVAPALDWKAVSLRWTADFTMPEVVRICKYPEDILVTEAHDAGDYIMIMRLPEAKDIVIGSKGCMHFGAGYYLYVGSAKANLTKRIERHKRKRKKMHWHLDYFRGHCEMIAAVPVRTSADLECPLAEAVKGVADWQVPGFGCSDCHCESHLFGMKQNPIHEKAFMDIVEEFRMNRLLHDRDL